MDKKTIQQYIDQYINNLKGKLTSFQALLYGSFLTDSYNENSDIDLLIISKDFENLDEDSRMDILYRNTTGLPLDWHLYGLTPKDIENVSPLSTLNEALKKGSFIYG